MEKGALRTISINFTDTLSKESGFFPNTFNFSVLGLGNSTYTHFNQAGRSFYRYLTKLQAVSACGYSETDDSKDAELQYENWVQKSINPLFVPENQQDSKQKISKYTKFNETVDYAVAKLLDIKLPEADVTDLNEAKRAKWLRCGYLVKVGEVRELCQQLDIFKESTKHVEFNLQSATQINPKLKFSLTNSKESSCFHTLPYWNRPVFCKYSTGQTLSIIVPNSTEHVERIFRSFTNNYSLNVTLDDIITPSDEFTDDVPSWFVGQSIRTILTFGCHLNGPLSRHILRQFSSFLKDKQKRRALQKFLENADLFTYLLKFRLTLCDCFEIFFHGNHSISDNFTNFLTALKFLPPPQPRSYSLSSSAYINPRVASIAVRRWSEPVFSYSAKSLRHAWLKGFDIFCKYIREKPKVHSVFSGFASSYLCDAPLCHALIQITDSTLKFPWEKVPTSVILVCTGTGLGPIRGYLNDLDFRSKKRYKINQKSEASRSDLGLPESVILVFGCRHPNKDFLYREEILDFLYSNKERPHPIITHFWPAFSRYPVEDSFKFQMELQKSVLSHNGLIRSASQRSSLAESSSNITRVDDDTDQSSKLITSIEEDGVHKDEIKENLIDFRDNEACTTYLDSIEGNSSGFGQYVQDVIDTKSEEFCAIMSSVEDVYFFVCGATAMGTQVQKTFTRIFSDDEATLAAWNLCKDSNKLCVDVW